MKQGCKHAEECKTEILQKAKIQPKKLLEGHKMPNKTDKLNNIVYSFQTSDELWHALYYY